MTPEGKVKQKVKAVLKPFMDKGVLWGDWPVPSGYGKGTLDFIGCMNGHFLSIETKAPGKTTTPLQDICIERIERAGGAVFVIGREGLKLTWELEALETWLHEHE
jgi:hypothetical protein